MQKPPSCPEVPNLYDSLYDSYNKNNLESYSSLKNSLPRVKYKITEYDVNNSLENISKQVQQNIIKKALQKALNKAFGKNTQEDVRQSVLKEGELRAKTSLIEAFRNSTVEELLTSEDETVRQLAALLIQKIKEDCENEDANLPRQTAQAEM